VDDIRTLVLGLQTDIVSLRDDVADLFSKADADTLMKNIVDTIIDKVNNAAKVLDLKIDEVKKLNDKEIKDLSAVRRKLKEIKKILDLIKKSREGEEVIVKSWFETE
jgi:endonuclease III